MLRRRKEEKDDDQSSFSSSPFTSSSPSSCSNFFVKTEIRLSHKPFPPGDCEHILHVQCRVVNFILLEEEWGEALQSRSISARFRGGPLLTCLRTYRAISKGMQLCCNIPIVVFSLSRERGISVSQFFCFLSFRHGKKGENAGVKNAKIYGSG